MGNEENQGSYEHTRALHRFVGDAAREIDQYLFGPSADIYYKAKKDGNGTIFVDINLPGFKTNEITVRLIPEKDDAGLFDERAHLHVVANRKRLEDIDKKFEVIMETRPTKYDFKIYLHVPIRESEGFKDQILKVIPKHPGVCSLEIPHNIPGVIVQQPPTPQDKIKA